MISVKHVAGAVCLWLYCFAPVQADVVIYRIPDTKLAFVLQGNTVVNPGRTTTFSHPKFGKIYFETSQIKIHDIPTPKENFPKVLGRAGNDAGKLIGAAHWALRHGLLPQCYQAAEKALEADPSHQRAILIRELRRKMDEPVSDSSKQESEMRQLIGRPDMKIRRSKHFVLMHDTPEKPPANRKVSRAEERLQLLEQVYESFLLRFYAHGVELEIPKEPLKVVLFQEHSDYLSFATKLSPSLSSAAGFWDDHNNTSIFYDHGSTEMFQSLKELTDAVQAKKVQAQKQSVKPDNLADIVRFADALTFLVEVERENSDLQVVSHEATHQMAGNTGLLPRHVRVPSWVHEGLATYFESTDGAMWGGVGAVNSERLQWYRTLGRLADLDIVVGDQIFDIAETHEEQLHGYAMAWALTHFLMERHFKEFMVFYRKMGELPPDVIFSPAVLTKLFNEAFGEAHSGLNAEWRTYMRQLKTETEIVMNSL